MTDRPFVLVIFSSANMEELHKMLVVEDPFSKEFDGKEESWELHHLTAASTSFFFSYLLRTLASLASSLAPFLFLVFSWNDFQSDRLFCQVLHLLQEQFLMSSTGAQQVVRMHRPPGRLLQDHSHPRPRLTLPLFPPQCLQPFMAPLPISHTVGSDHGGE